jgi:hypothetical protein
LRRYLNIGTVTKTEDSQLGDEIATMAARVNVVNQQLLARIRRFDAIEGWYRQGAMSCAHWLTWRIGLDRGAAREKVRVARVLGTLPRIDAAFAAGRLSYAQVRAVTRVANAENEERLLEVALAATGAQLERICRGLRSATRNETEAARERSVRARVLGNGLVKLEIVVTPDESTLILDAIERAREDLTPRLLAAATVTGATAATDESKSVAAPRPSAVDALLHLVSNAITHQTNSAEPISGTPSEIVIHVDRDLTESDGTLSARLEDGTPVSAETLRRVCCDAGIVPAAVDDQGAVLDVGRRTRAIPSAIRRALWIRDQGCRFPGCMNQRYIHGHHIKHWLHGGPTSLDNLVLLCAWHHRLLHEAGFSATLSADGELEVRTPAGALLPAHPALATDRPIVEWRAGADEWHGDRDDPEVDEWTTMPSWDGERMDLDWVVGTLV